jgi:hypothetical protein
MPHLEEAPKTDVLNFAPDKLERKIGDQRFSDRLICTQVTPISSASTAGRGM